MQFESVRRWLNGLRNEVTRKNYVFVFYGYCQETQMAPNQLLAEKEASLGNPNMRGAAEDRLTLWYHRKEASAPGTAVLTFKSVRSFFKANYLPLSATIPSYIKQREEEYLPSRAEVKALCELADLETSTFLLFCAESGQRDGTIADLTLSHVEDCLNGEPYIFTIPQKRNRYGKILKSKRIYGKYGFVCADAVEKLKVLLKTKPNLGVENKIFENEPGSYSRTVRTMAYRLGINRNNRGLRRFHVHCLRKRAQTIMEEYIPLNWVDRILGHKPRGSQADAYSIPSKEKLAEKYASAADALRIYGEEKQEESEVDELKQRITELEALVGKLAN